MRAPFAWRRSESDDPNTGRDHEAALPSRGARAVRQYGVRTSAPVTRPRKPVRATGDGQAAATGRSRIGCLSARIEWKHHYAASPARIVQPRCGGTEFATASVLTVTAPAAGDGRVGERTQPPPHALRTGRGTPMPTGVRAATRHRHSCRPHRPDHNAFRPGLRSGTPGHARHGPGIRTGDRRTSHRPPPPPPRQTRASAAPARTAPALSDGTSTRTGTGPDTGAHAGHPPASALATRTRAPSAPAPARRAPAPHDGPRHPYRPARTPTAHSAPTPAPATRTRASPLPTGTGDTHMGHPRHPHRRHAHRPRTMGPGIRTARRAPATHSAPAPAPAPAPATRARSHPPHQHPLHGHHPAPRQP